MAQRLLFSAFVAVAAVEACLPADIGFELGSGCVPEIFGIGGDAGFKLGTDSVPFSNRCGGQGVKQFHEPFGMTFCNRTDFVCTRTNRRTVIVETKMTGGDSGGKGFRDGQARRHPPWFRAVDVPADLATSEFASLVRGQLRGWAERVIRNHSYSGMSGTNGVIECFRGLGAEGLFVAAHQVLKPSLKALGLSDEELLQAFAGGTCSWLLARGWIDTTAAGLQHHIQIMQCREQLPGVFFMDGANGFRCDVLVRDDARI